MTDFRPGNKTHAVKFSVESEFQVKNTDNSQENQILETTKFKSISPEIPLIAIKVLLKALYMSRRVFGHSLESLRWILTKIGGNLPTGLPELSKPSRTLIQARKPNLLRKPIFEKF